MKTIMLWCAMLFALYGECFAGFAILRWDPPSTYMDGTSIADQAGLGYKVYMGIAPGVYTTIIDVGPGMLVPDEPCVSPFVGCITRSYTLYGLAPGITYYFVVTAYEEGLESDFSNEVQKMILTDALLPGDATLFTATPYSTGVRLSWTNPPDQDLVRVILEYNFSGGSFINLVLLKAVPGKAQTYDHLGLMPGIYSYALHTRDSSGNTTHTAYANATINNAEQPTTPETTNIDIPQLTTGDTLQLTTPPSSGGCFIATAAYGSYLDPHVVMLRKFRDEHLLTNAPGRAFVAAYYTVSPPIADFIARHDTAKTIVRIGLMPVIFALEYPITSVLILLVLIGEVFRLRQRKQ